MYSYCGSTMLKLTFLLLASCCLVAQAAHELPSRVADKSFVINQKKIYELFWHIDQPTLYYGELYQKARSFNLEENVNNYDDKEASHELVQWMKHGMLPRGQLFSIMDHDVFRQAVILYRVLYSAPSFDLFYDTAVWARFHVNEHMYLYTLSVAVLQRPDTKFMKIPPWYEVVPHFFFNGEVLHQACNIAVGDINSPRKNVDGINIFSVSANYTGSLMTKHDAPEHKMTYFTEDVGLNTFYFLINHHFPKFIHSSAVSSVLKPEIRGELYFFIHKQLLNRYYLERLSNDMGEINYVSLDKPIVTGYYPTMHFHNGHPFPHRETNAIVPLHMHKYVQMIKDIHGRISAAIDAGYVINPQGGRVNIYSHAGLNILGNIVQGNADSINERLYGNLDTLIRNVLGFGMESNAKYHSVPSALEIYSASMRDPVFYSMYKNILTYYHRYKENLPKYTKQELTFPGVNIESVTVDKLITYFDSFESMLNNGLSIRSQKEADSFLIKAHQYRLNHKPYTYHIKINSDKSAKAVIRVFLGPKLDEFEQEYDLEHNFMNFLQMDEWIVDLKAGSNTIDRSSHESIFSVPDEVPSDVMHKKLVKSAEGVDAETYKYSTQRYGFPDRLMLPKGKKEGMEYKLFVVVSPFVEDESTVVESPILGPLTFDGRPMGYPLDRPINPLEFNVPNIYFKDVVILHKELEELNIVV